MRFAILGAGGFARECAHVIHSIRGDRGDEYLYFADNPEEWGNQISFGTVVGSIEDYSLGDRLSFVSAVGSPAVKKKLADRAIARGWSPMMCIKHPQSFFGAGEAGNGTVICSFCSITDNVNIGEYVIVNLNCTIGHDVVIEDYVTLSPHCTISGHCHIKHGAELGSNVTVIPGVTIGENSIVGAGAVVIDDVPDNTVVVAKGVKGQVIKKI